MNKWKERRVKHSPTLQIKELTARQFLGKDGCTPYITPKVLLDFNDDGREDDVSEMSAMFSLANARHRIIVTRKVRTDKGRNRYKFQNFNRNGNPDGAKVVLIGNIEQFLEDLYDNKFVINFTYDDLIEEAEQA